MSVLVWSKPPLRTRVRDDRLLDCLCPLQACPLLDDLVGYWRGE